MTTIDATPAQLTADDYLPEYEGTVRRVAHREGGIVEVWFHEENLAPLGFVPEFPLTITIERH